MARPKGARSKSLKPTNPTKLEQIELICRITGKSFHSYKGPNGQDPLPISLEGWNTLTDEQKSAINLGAKLEDIL